MKILLLTLLLAPALYGQTPQAPQKSAPPQGPPPKKLTVRPDGHVTANQDPSNPERFELHVVKQGETLSQIAGEVLKNPRLWPQLWEQNEHIINPHWIYPNDKILIRPVVAITEARPPQPEPEPEPPRRPSPPRQAPAPAPEPPQTGTPAFELEQQKPVSEVKFEDLYCSGFVRTAPVSKDLKVTSKFDSSGAVLAGEADYIYLGKGSEGGITAGTVYQVVRPTRTLKKLHGDSGGRNIGMHYLDIAQVRVMVTQSDFALARVLHNCGDAVEVGDILMPFNQIVLPALARPRTFNPMIKATGDVKGDIVATKNVLLNFGSAFKVSGILASVGGHLASVERGVASEGEIVYIGVGQTQGVKAGDVFIVYRNVNLDKRLYEFPKEADRLKNARSAVGELIVLKVGESGSTALVTYASDGLVQGDAVERR